MSLPVSLPCCLLDSVEPFLAFPQLMLPKDLLRETIARGFVDQEEIIARGFTFEQYDGLLTKVMKEKRSVKVKLLDGEVTITDFPSGPHGYLRGIIDAVVARANQFGEADPLGGSGSLRLQGAGQNGIEPDSSFFNRRQAADFIVRCPNHCRVAVIVVEIATVESWSTTIRTAEKYFGMGVLQVIYVKLYKTEDPLFPAKCCLTQMYTMDFRRPSNYVPGSPVFANQVISFGHRKAHNATVQAIRDRTGVDEASFVGYGVSSSWNSSLSIDNSSGHYLAQCSTG
jgi:Uma2 family endonuclease